MKKHIKFLALFCTLIFTISACQDDDHTFGDLNSPNGLETTFEIQGQDNDLNPDGDGSGNVKFTSIATNAISYKYIFSDGSTANSPNGVLTKRFTKNGTNSYDVTVIASGKGGVSSTHTFSITVFSNFKDDEAVAFLTGGTSKTWYVAANEKGHLGVGPNNTDPAKNFIPDYYSANPFEKAGGDSACFYDNELVFILDGELVKMYQNNGGSSFFNKAFFPTGPGGGDACIPWDTSAPRNVLFSPSESILMETNPSKTRGTSMTFADSGFMAYYINQTTYEILTITENRMEVRAIMGGDPSLAWYLIFTTTKPVQQTGPVVDDTFTNLVWSDEFDVAGAPNPANWGYDLGAGGWGNGEAQYYRDVADNVKVEGGFLKITAKKQTFGGSSYTSSRILTKDKREYTYGKVEARIKLPEGVGTWPAFWMLGANNSEVPWPGCGEVDIMEHKGYQPGIIHGTLHYPGNSAGGGPTQSMTVPNVSSEFHNYSVVWTAGTVKFYVDNMLFHTFNNNASTPFNSDFFIILNVAMGGGFGGPIDPNFVQSTMEIDYVRVYQ